jgi:sulfatase maturation enzyme AslB (radical SAM superfamily)
MTTPSASFCVLPWIHLFADERGVIHPCCFSHETPVVDRAGASYRAGQPNALPEAFGSDLMRGIRRQMLLGERPAACATCYKIEDLGGPSYRQAQNRDYAELIPELVRETTPDGDAPQRYRYVDVRLGNVCNLRCRMCSPQASRLLVDEFQEIRGLAPDNPWLASVRALDWFESPEFWEALARHLPSIDRLHFAGGEPLMIRQGFEFLRRIVELGHAPHITLTYNTNVTVLPKEIEEYWSQFRGVVVIASLDGYDAVNHYIRYPARWRTIDRNLRLLDEEHERLNVTRIDFHATLQAYNILAITDLFDYLFERFAFADPYAHMDVVNNWPELDIQILPADLKRLATERLESFKERVRRRAPDDPRLAPFLGRIDAVLGHMHGADQSRRIPQFRRTTAIYDERRGQRLADVVPELAPLMVEPTGWRAVVARVVSALRPAG